MRKTLYFKDDDAKMSFLYGNYITLTNLEDSDIDLIIKRRLSPINISVHTTDPKLRVEMMKNPKAADSLKYIDVLAKNGIKINVQLVLCPGINDGDALWKSLWDLQKYYPNLQSVACVPVGITKYREGLFPLEPYTKEQALKTVKVINNFNVEMLKAYSTRLAYPSDEFFLLAQIPVPTSDYYGDYQQLDNGVGLITMLREEFVVALSEKSNVVSHETTLSIATGVLAEPIISELAALAMKKFENVSITVYAIKNVFFGETITVAGLITGQDLIAQLKGKPLGDKLLISGSMLKSDENIFLDDISLEQVENQLQIKIVPVNNDGSALLEAMIVT